MANLAVDKDKLIDVRDHLCKNIVSMLSDKEKEFLVSLVEIDPKWDLLALPIDIKELPSIKFKLMNLERMESRKRKNTLINYNYYFLEWIVLSLHRNIYGRYYAL